MYSVGGMASCIKMAQIFGHSYHYYRNVLNAMSQNAVEYYEVKACNLEHARYWPIMFLRRLGDDGYDYLLRDELMKALGQMNILHYFENTNAKGRAIVIKIPTTVE